MKNKKVLALMLVVVMILVTACGNNAGSSSQTEAEQGTSEASSDEVTDEGTDEGSEEEVAEINQASEGTLSVMIWDSYQEPGISKIMDDFTAETGIQTEIQVVSWDEYWTLLSAGAEGGSLPDVFWMHSNESERYMSNDMLLNLSDRIAASTEIETTNYPEDIWSLYTYEDGYYAIPKDIDTIAMWYNKALFDEAGVDYPTADWTWDDLYEKAKALTKDDGSVYGYCNASSNQQAGWYNMIFSKGGYIISDDKMTSGYDDPKTIEAMAMMDKFVQEDLMPSQEIMSETGEEVLFMSGKVAMVPQGSWMLAAMAENEYTAENADVVELPKDSETGRRVSVYNGLGWVVDATTDMPDEAWQLVEYFGSKEGQLKQAELGITMSAYTGTSDTWVNSSPQFNLQAYLNMQDDMEIRPFSKNTVIWENTAADWFLQAWMKEITMEEACMNSASDMNRILGEQ